jgi:hypothetical protein
MGAQGNLHATPVRLQRRPSSRGTTIPDGHSSKLPAPCSALPPQHSPRARARTVVATSHPAAHLKAARLALRCACGMLLEYSNTRVASCGTASSMRNSLGWRTAAAAVSCHPAARLPA